MRYLTRVFSGSLISILICQQAAFGAQPLARIAMRPTVPWNATPVRISDGVTYRTFHRLVLTQDLAYEIGSVVSFIAPKTKDFSWDLIDASVRSAFKGSEVIVRANASARAYDIDWRSGNRVVRLFVSEKEGKIRYVSSTFRRAYAAPMMLETEVLMRELSGIAPASQKKPRWIERLVSWLWAKDPSADAFAGGCSIVDINCLLGGNGVTIGGGTLNTNSNINITGLDGVTGSVNGATSSANTNLPPLTGAINNAAGAGNSLSVSGNNVATSINNASNAGNNLAAAGNNASAAMNNATNMLNARAGQGIQAVQNTNNQLAAINSTLAGFQNQHKMAELFAASAAGAALGTLAVSLAASGVASAFDFLSELITHKKEKAELMQRFIAAREAYEKSKDQIKQLELAIDHFSDLNDMLAKSHVTRDEFITQLGPSIEMTQAKLNLDATGLEDAIRSGDQSCAEHYASEAASYRSLLNNYKAIAAAYPQKDTMCEDMSRNLRLLKQAEGLLQQARVSILSAQDVWNDQSEKEEDLSEKGMSRSRTINNSVLENQLKREQARRDREMASADKDENALIDRCVAVLEKTDNRFFFAGTRRKSSCRDAVEGLPSDPTDAQLVQVFGSPKGGDIASFRQSLSQVLDDTNKLAERRRDINESYNSTKAAREKMFAEAKELKSEIGVNERIARGLTDADNEWFNDVLKEQAHAGERQKLIEEKAKKVAQVCGAN